MNATKKEPAPQPAPNTTGNNRDKGMIKSREIKILPLFVLIYDFRLNLYTILPTWQLLQGQRPEGIIMSYGTFNECESELIRIEGGLR